MAQSLKSVSVITLFVADEQRSKEFYERVFEVAAVDEDEGRRPWGVRNAAFRDPDGHLWVLSSDIPAAERK